MVWLVTAAVCMGGVLLHELLWIRYIEKDDEQLRRVIADVRRPPLTTSESPKNVEHTCGSQAPPTLTNKPTIPHFQCLRVPTCNCQKCWETLVCAGYWSDASAVVW